MAVRLTAESGAIVEDPSRDVLADLLGAVGRGEEAYLVVERAEDTFAQVTQHDERWTVERRAGGDETHEVADLADLAGALDVLAAWIDGSDPETTVDWRPLDG